MPAAKIAGHLPGQALIQRHIPICAACNSKQRAAVWMPIHAAARGRGAVHLCVGGCGCECVGVWVRYVWVGT
eukprot:scaffold199420_cov21-Tisochrysis_lutea.AAC.1